MKGKLTCDGCDECCHYVALEIDRPTCKKDYSDLFWHLLHEGVAVYIGHDKSWNLEFASRCSKLTDEGLCGDYENRPVICREYSHDTCTRHSSGEYYLYKFHEADELKAYLRKKKVDFEFRKRKKKKA